MQLTRSFAEPLSALNDDLGTDIAIISSVVDACYTILEVQAPSDFLDAGRRFPLGDTYCHQVVQDAKTISYDALGRIRAEILHPVYTAMQLEAYVGTPLWYERKIIGTLSFSGFGPKVGGFNAQDLKKVEQLAAEISTALEPKQ
ncbi:GAF domain-containing protein [Reinekea blandensis]|uniref:11-domain light and oxygen sensing his kinase n=1 Tax=Reinekea blandensis MED297 TaxID=314283 RepID=A4BIJ2_9GAMM|nr:GAF domain-containing protein [Reinekea blandensis]EAR08071.1 11-domain light and oxygen sensing his kinase [Reinekea sp. MED297] [Reinekea blandensis MED297]